MILSKGLKKISLFLLITVGAINFGIAQTGKTFYQNNYPRILSNFGDTLSNAWNGGLFAAQFNSMDLNGDGKQDLVIIDRSDDHLMTFLNRSESGGIPDFEYAPQFEYYFPQVRATLILKDYNNDGKKDLFTLGQSGGIAVYLNNSNGSISFKLMSPELWTMPYMNEGFEDSINIYLGANDIPVIEDVDFDGDMDILTNSFGYFTLYENQAIDSGYSLKSLEFKESDYCWGQFFVQGGETMLQLNPNYFACKGKNRSTLPGFGKKHSGNSLVLFDKDGDKDYDMLIGEALYDGLAFAENGKNDFSHPVDSAVSFTTSYPANKPVQLSYLPTAFLLDVNDDNLNDLIVTPQDVIDGQSINQVWLYLNEGTNENPDFKFETENFLQDQMLDLGTRTFTQAFDYDDDGDEDLIISTKGNLYQTSGRADRLFVYENISDSVRPIFELAENNWLNISQDSLRDLYHNFGDLNGDGLEDMVIGMRAGNILYYENQGLNNGTYSFSKLADTLARSKNIFTSYPEIADVDGDGLNDLLVGVSVGRIYYFKNTGNEINGIPEFELIDENWQGINTQSSIFINYVDLNLDGKEDLLYNEGSILKAIYDIEASNDKVIDTLVYDSLLKRSIAKNWGFGLAPSIAHLDQDSLPDIVLSTQRGGISFLGSKPQFRDSLGLSKPDVPKSISFNLFPNPTKDQFTINWDSGSNDLSLTAYSSLGRIIERVELKRESGSRKIDISAWPAGTYIIRFSDENGDFIQTRKLVKIGQ